MPLTKKGNKILTNMKKTYGAKKASQVLYSMINEGKITGAEDTAKKQPRKQKKKKKNR